MSHSLAAVEGSATDEIKINRALLSVSNKDGLIEFAKFLADQKVELLSTGGTAKALRTAGLTVQDVSDYTGHPEIMDGRVKTLHPKVHGGIMYVRGNISHEKEKESQGIKSIDLVVLNLYPFQATVDSGKDFSTCIENIDIGGPSMLRSSAKNHKYVAISTSPTQYPEIMCEMATKSGGTSLGLRKRLAAAAFSLSAQYDGSIASWIQREAADDASEPPKVAARVYTHEFPLKYGCNPHQSPAGIYSISGNKGLPFAVLNGTPGYINLLDALNAWQLVRELATATGLCSAASFKHCSPAGAAVGVPLSDEERAVYDCLDLENITPSAAAYLRARNADPMSSFGDFAALSHTVDEATAKVLKREVSDGIIAPGFEPGALAVLSSKKGGKFIVLKADPGYEPGRFEYREAFGTTFQQRRNERIFDLSDLEDVRTEKKDLSDSAKRDLVVATISIKYTQSNSVGYAKNGQMVGVGAGQQSRVDCVKLAGKKVQIWHMRHHPKVKGLKFKSGVKRQDKVNARVRYIEGDFTASEIKSFESLFEAVPEPITKEEIESFMRKLKGVSLSSDAFFPFRDSIDHASKFGVEYIAQAGGSVMDDEVVKACDEYEMAMAFTKLRLFHH